MRDDGECGLKSMAQAERSAANEDLAQIRESVRALCAKFPGEYWRALDRERAYPTEFVAALTQAGFLAALIPEEYGGSGLSMTAAAAIMEEIQASGCNGAACHAQMYTMGTLLRHGSAAQKARWLPAIASGELRLQAFGVTEPIVTAENLIGEEGQGFRYILSGMNAERILIAAECIGDAKWFIAKATGYAKERIVFGRPIGQNQGVQFPIARAYAQMRAAELMVGAAAALYEVGRECSAEANMAKLLAADASWAAADMCLQTHGGFGFAEEFDVERKFRETRLYQTAPISTNLILSYLAEHVLGLPRSY